MNVDWVFHLPAPLRRAGYFTLQRLIGSRIGPVWREFQAWERFAPEEVSGRVDGLLIRLLDHATTQSGYYRKLGLHQRGGESVRQFLQRFPVLTREQVRAHFADLVVDALQGQITSPASVANKRYDWLVVKTGGTTGVPTSVIHDARFRDWGRATRLFSQRLCGFPLGTRYFRLWGSEPDLLQQSVNLERRVLRNLLGEIPLNAFRAKEAELAQHLKTIESYPRVQHLMAYVDAAVSLAMFIEERSLPRPAFKTVMACAGTVTGEWRQKLQEIFRADVFDKYGSRECADLACECSHHTGLHVYSPNVYLEVVDDAGEACPPGETGRILVTLLNNLSFPMIRYAIGDLGVWAEPGLCPCGLPFPRLQSLQGRQDDMLTTEDGTSLSSVFVRHFVGVSLNRQLIREWQLEQTGRGEFTFRYIPLKQDGLADNLRDLEASFRLAFGQNARIQMGEVGEIQPSTTGKVRWVINSFARPGHQRSMGITAPVPSG